MNKFKENILNIYKEEGKRWLDNLPLLINELSNLWQLTNLNPIKNLSFNFLLTGLRAQQPIVLKVSLDHKAAENEAMTLKAWNGRGAVKLVEFNNDLGALLLEQAIDGDSLLSYAIEHNHEAIEIACRVIQKLHSVPSNLGVPNISEWLAILDKVWDIPKEYLIKARKLRDQLLYSTQKQILLHGDLHHDNLIRNNDQWLAIDPKGVIGDPISEYYTMVRNPLEDITLIAEITGYNKERIRDWCYVRGILSACWCLEDNLDPNVFLGFVEKTQALYTNSKL